MITLTGDRPTGCLHLGHYIGSLKNRIEIQNQNTYEQFILIADLQALTDNYNKSESLQENIFKILACYLAVGIDPEKNTIFLQSMIPQLYELTIFFMNLVSVARLSRNPTVKEEIIQKGFSENLSIGFLSYPISQAADILLFNAEKIPVGIDQLPMIEQTNEIAKSFNHIYKTNYFKTCQAILSNNSKIIGIDGKSKMSKSLANAIFLNDSKEMLLENIMKMYTDPNHLKINDPGKIEGNVVFTYLDIFFKNKEELADLKNGYQKGGIGDVYLKKLLFNSLNEILNPIRDKYYLYYNDKTKLKEILLNGTLNAQKIAIKNINNIKEIMKIKI
jgi:tryptophanyl-tRNA synthetase